MSTAPVVPAAPVKESWLKRVGHDVGVALGFVAKEAVPIAQAAGSVVATLLPQFAPEINMAENLVSKIASQATVTEGAFAAVGQASNGAAKLQAVLSSVGPEIDAWVTSSFPGATALSATAKAGLVNAVVGILNDIKPSLGLTATASAVSAGAAASAAVAAAKPA